MFDYNLTLRVLEATISREVTINGEKQIIPPKKRLKEFEITKSVRYGDIAVLYDLFKQYGLIELLN